jgi:hypothetical protein
MNIDFWLFVFCTVCKVNFPTTFRDPQWFPKRREIHLAHRVKTQKPKINKINISYQSVFLWKIVTDLTSGENDRDKRRKK